MAYLDAMESLVMCCPRCDILITVMVQDCLEGREFPCPICGEVIAFKFTPEEMEQKLEMAKKNQERALRRQFPLTFGDV
ncbi:MAG TPA: hypothetical protein PKO24_03745 [Methanomassiliicoccales archaeon]|jgi:transcription initiation factor TFIIIB Brf1 subunit/transcription initiation factor TFIIB|nr:hypothetical protein [Methanomassiliicoccales archaeon]MCE5260426.1 hypothetical protein [Euryarchaeota archaeon]HOE52732.1 hypothetical protein [Methanomassiliicoccales archaeon]HOO03109.1 hypothetical protein [Methanomassiliicoccales archaeon]HPD08360.1 hypothetical protein [Methanomassiliicoccales archaeon]